MTRRNSKGKTPEEERALELLRQRVTLLDVSIATRIPTATIKRWARKAGLEVTLPTAEQKAERQSRWERTRRARRAYGLEVTAEMVRSRIGSDRKP